LGAVAVEFNFMNPFAGRRQFTGERGEAGLSEAGIFDASAVRAELRPAIVAVAVRGSLWRSPWNNNAVRLLQDRLKRPAAISKRDCGWHRSGRYFHLAAYRDELISSNYRCHLGG